MKWTVERQALLRKLWGDGMLGADIAAQMGISESAVGGGARRFGLPRRQSPGRWLISPRNVASSKPTLARVPGVKS
jgi:hypothetical protein